MRYIFLLVAISMSMLVLNSCKPANPSVLKIYIRNNSNQLVQGADLTVVLEPDVVSEFYTFAKTNTSGYALIDLEPLFDQYDPKLKEKTAEFRVYITGPNGDQTTKKVRARAHMTTVHTIHLLP